MTSKYSGYHLSKNRSSIRENLIINLEKVRKIWNLPYVRNLAVIKTDCSCDLP